LEAFKAAKKLIKWSIEKLEENLVKII
jgi:hypothetical protein